MAGRPLRDRFLSGACHLLRKMPYGRRSLFNVFRWLTGNPERFVMRTQGRYFVVDCLDHDVAMRVALNQAYEPVVGALFLSFVQPGSVVLDVGANKGYYTLLAASRVGSSGHVIAYEPDPRNLSDIEQVVLLNGLTNIEVVGHGMSDRRAIARFNIAGWQEQNSAWGRIVSDSEANGCEVEIQTCTLDQELERLSLDRVDVVKMDIQGGEREAVRGMQSALKAGRIGVFMIELHDTILCEAECEEILNKIHEAGYTGKFYQQSEFTPSEALAALSGDLPLNLAQRGCDSSTYDFNIGREASAYRKPCQFIFHKS